jgi:hypothetical protein
MYKPFAISPLEWAEIFKVPSLRKDWKIGNEETPKTLSLKVCGAKFKYEKFRRSEEFTIDLYMIQKHPLETPRVLIKCEGRPLFDLSDIRSRLKCPFCGNTDKQFGFNSGLKPHPRTGELLFCCRGCNVAPIRAHSKKVSMELKRLYGIRARR